MKKIIIPVLMLSLTLVNCKNNSKENDETNASIEAIDTSFNDSIGMEEPLTNSDVSEGTENWDTTIDEYESFIDDYIDAMKKMKDGDMSVASDLISMQEQAESLSEKLKNAEKDLTKEQMKRFIKLQTKISNAVVDMQ